MKISEAAKKAAKSEVFEASNPRSPIDLGFHVQTAIDAETAPLKAHLDRVVNAVPESFREGRGISEAVEFMRRYFTAIEESLRSEIQSGIKIANALEGWESIEGKTELLKSVRALRDQSDTHLSDSHSKHCEIERLKKELDRVQAYRNSESVAAKEMVKKALDAEVKEKSRADALDVEVQQLSEDRYKEQQRAAAAEKRLECKDGELERLRSMVVSEQECRNASESSLAAMREALEKILTCKMIDWLEDTHKPVLDKLKQALSTDAGKGWMSPEEAARVKAMAQDAIEKSDLMVKDFSEAYKRMALNRDPFERLVNEIRSIMKPHQDTDGSAMHESWFVTLEKYLPTVQAELDRTKGGDLLWQNHKQEKQHSDLTRETSSIETEKVTTKGGDEPCRTANVTCPSEGGDTKLTVQKDPAVSTSPAFVPSVGGAAKPYAGPPALVIEHRQKLAESVQIPDWTDPKAWEQFPPWVMAIAKDADNTCYKYEIVPEIRPTLGDWFSMGRIDRAFNIQIPGDWKDSLRKRPVAKPYAGPPESRVEEVKKLANFASELTDRMTARDFFAGCTMITIALNNPQKVNQSPYVCFKHADDMMVERNRRAK